MQEVLYVHGTGVREPVYSDTFWLIEKKLTARRTDLQLKRCYWGSEHGARLFAGGLSIPGFDTKRDPTAPLDDRESAIALWSLLYQDPLLEVRLLGLDEKPFVPGRRPGDVLEQAVRAVTPNDTLATQLGDAGLADVFVDARNIVVGDADFRQMIPHVSTTSLNEYQRAVARALIAQSVVLARSVGGSSAVVMSSENRELLVNGIIEALGGDVRGVGAWVKTKFAGVLKRVATNRIDRHRGRLSEDASGAAGDVLLYQARGDGIRSFIREEIAKSSDPVVLIAHSLGGIACVDLLIREAPVPGVRLLVTVGSQAPLLYELNALTSVPYAPEWRLPDRFPPWLNIYDEHDFLSYAAAKVFPGAHDEMVDNGQPFPESHSAYWANGRVWDAILSKLR